MPEPVPFPRIELGALAPALESTCGDYLSQYRARIEDAVRRGEGGVEVARKNAKSLDGLLSALCCACEAASRADSRLRFALVAVGGYGRGVVGVESDVDVLFLCDDAGDERVAAIAEGLLYPLWDLGVQIGHAVRSVEETLALGREDIRTATTLLDLRRVAGDQEIVTELHRRARRHIFEPHLEQFLDMLLEDTERRHERFGDSLYLLEPEVKLGRGGLRDMDVAEWAMGARWSTRGAEGYVRTGALLTREAEGLEAAREFFWKVRNLLHLRAGRRQDRLTFADQEDVSEHLGFVDGVTLGVEQFMQAYYRHARSVAQTAERVIARARPRRKTRPKAEDLGDGTLLFDGQVTLLDSAELMADPSLALRFYARVAEAEAPAYPFARDAIAHAAADPDWCESLRASPDAQRMFLETLTRAAEPFEGMGRRSIFAELHEVGLMTAMVPEFEPLMGRVQHDVYHVYTVDVHSVRAVDRLAALVRGDLRKELPLACRLAAEAPRKEPLFLGLLLHDVGKARGKDHATTGAAIARPIAERLGLSPVDVEHVVWLVREHLSLYKWATRRDTGDPETIAEIAREVGSVEALRDLYLLTVADVSTTNPTAMTTWKARMFEDLYLAVAAVLDGEVRGSTRAAEIRDQMRERFAGDVSAEALGAFLDGMPDRYVLGTPADAIEIHALAACARGSRPVHVVVGLGPNVGLADLIVMADDQEGLLAAVTAVLASHRLSVVSAEIHTRQTEDGAEAFDVFHVRRHGNVAHGVDEQAAAAVAADVRQVIAGAVTGHELLSAMRRSPSWAARRVPDVPTQVVVDNDISSRFTVVDVFTRDRIGLLHEIAKTIHEAGLSIAVSKIGTEGARATDVFYVHDANGKIRDSERLAALQRLVRDAIDAFHTRQGEES